MRRIASAISGAMLIWRTLRDTRTASVAWIVPSVPGFPTSLLLPAEGISG